MDEQNAIRNHYAAQGVDDYYKQHGATYRNPHEPIIQELFQITVSTWHLNLSHVLDLACGSGEITMILRGMGAKQIDGIDPYTGSAYQERTGHSCESFSFEEIAQGVLTGRNYSLIVCSFAMHLVDVSWLPTLCFQLRQVSDKLMIVTPHKRPEIKAVWGWHLQEETLHKRVRARLYTGP